MELCAGQTCGTIHNRLIENRHTLADAPLAPHRAGVRRRRRPDSCPFAWPRELSATLIFAIVVARVRLRKDSRYAWPCLAFHPDLLYDRWYSALVGASGAPLAPQVAVAAPAVGANATR